MLALRQPTEPALLMFIPLAYLQVTDVMLLLKNLNVFSTRKLLMMSLSKAV